MRASQELYNELIRFVQDVYPKYGYREVLTPQLFRSDLFKTSGHYEKFHDDMYWFEGSDEGEELGVKAMNCPGHCHLFNTGKRSYRELPVRWAEFSRLHRNERSGTLNGITRVRTFAQDDAHIFCEPDQVPSEIDAFFRMTAEVYEKLGVEGVEMAVSTRPEEFLGEPEDWDIAEKALIEAVERAGFVCQIKEGDAAFTPPRSRRISRMCSGGPGRSRRSRSIWPCRGALGCHTSVETGSSISPQCSTGPFLAHSSASSGSTSSTREGISPSGWLPSRS